MTFCTRDFKLPVNLTIIFFFKICLLIITLNNYIYKTHTKKNTLTRDINRVKQKKIVKLLQEVLQG